MSSATSATMDFPILGLLPLLPLLGSIFVFLRRDKGELTQKASGWFATTFAVAAFAVALFSFTVLNGSGVGALSYTFQPWFHVGDLKVNFGFRFDNLTAVMCLIITGVGSLIHLYAIGYMEGDPHRKRFFSYLNLFLFAMLLLVLGDNLLMMFVGWEGVGLCSYLLIGFWHKEMPNAVAGQKAFVVNRIGDAGFLMGIFTLFWMAGTVTFTELASGVSALPPGVIEFAAFALFVGAMGKSAQIPLYIWLPDAMAGPTPVSALIHAATMVTAGIYMIARTGFLFAAAPTTSMIIMIIGSLTALVAATIALVQWDIKKVLAYSTVSQLGFMFMAMGAGAYSNGMFHVVTHAFFKACLFMGAGSVIIGCHHEQDMRRFGGLRKYMPWTFATYFVATLAIAGFPFLSGFFSKDAILWTVFSADNLSAEVTFLGFPVNQICWGVGAFTALLTAFYMTRSLMLTFFGSYRGHDGHHDHHSDGHHHDSHGSDTHSASHGAHGGDPHESPWVVTVPLALLAVLSAGFGYLYGHDLIHFLGAWTRPDMLTPHEELAKNPLYHTLELVSIGIALVGIGLAVFVYAVQPKIVQSLAHALPGLYQALSNKWWVDELYDLIVVRPLRTVSGLLFTLIDRAVIDSSVNGAGMVVEASGDVVHRVHTGHLSAYLLWMFAGSVAFAVIWFLL